MIIDIIYISLVIIVIVFFNYTIIQRWKRELLDYTKTILLYEIFRFVTLNILLVMFLVYVIVFKFFK